MQTNWRTSMIIALGAAHLSLAVVVLEDPANEWCRDFGPSLLMSQAALLATWIALGKSQHRVRKTMGLLFAIGLLSGGRHGLFSSLAELAVISIGATALLAALALPWVRLQRRDFELVDFGDAPPSGVAERLRFSLRHVFACTTAVAVLLAAGQWGRLLVNADGGEARSVSPPFAVAVAAFLLQFVVVMLLAGWAALRPGDFRLRLAALLFSVAVLGLYVPYCFGSDERQCEKYAGASLAYATILFASLLVVRACGYRLVRSNGSGQCE